MVVFRRRQSIMIWCVVQYASKCRWSNNSPKKGSYVQTILMVVPLDQDLIQEQTIRFGLRLAFVLRIQVCGLSFVVWPTFESMEKFKCFFLLWLYLGLLLWSLSSRETRIGTHKSPTRDATVLWESEIYRKTITSLNYIGRLPNTSSIISAAVCDHVSQIIYK